MPTVPEPVAPGSVPISQLHAGPGPRVGLVTSGPNSFSTSEVFSSAQALLAFAGSAPAGAAAAAATAHPRTTLVSRAHESLRLSAQQLRDALHALHEGVVGEGER